MIDKVDKFKQRFWRYMENHFSMIWAKDCECCQLNRKVYHKFIKKIQKLIERLKNDT